MSLNQTHDPALRSWVSSANEPPTDFPIQNLPFGRFRRVASGQTWRIGVAIGNQILDLKLALELGTWDADMITLLVPLARGDLNTFMAQPPVTRGALRAALSQALSAGCSQQASLDQALLAQTDAEMSVPCSIGDYTDFYTGIHHATAVGKLFRPDNPLLANYKWVPIGYHGRASSIGVSGHTFKRPLGQTRGEGLTPNFGPAKRLDYELELGIFVGPGNDLGAPIDIQAAEDHLFGLCLLNDWSARDVQAWEYQPLGPFLAKNFATTVSPWIVTMEALTPYRCEFKRPAGDPQPLPYLDSAENRQRGALNITLEVWLQTAKMRSTGDYAVCLSRSEAAESAYWTFAQLVTHHTVNGCNLRSGDLLGSGTLSGPRPEQGGSLLELSLGGSRQIDLPNGEQRTFLEDGDTVILRGYCIASGFPRIGFGELVGSVAPCETERRNKKYLP